MESEEAVEGKVCQRYHRAIELVGARWNGAIIKVLLSERCRFSEIIESIPGVSDRLLSQRLKELEQEGIVKRKVFPETPVRIEYRLTQKGRDLEEVVTAVEDWVSKWDTKLPAKR